MCIRDRRDIVYYPNATSCGTATATSLPCMFSPLTKDAYSYEGGLSNENLLDVLMHAGFDVEWWDNNTGDKDIADRLPVRPHTMKAEDGPEFCFPECIDAVFLKGLQDKADTITGNTVIVLHQIGSHGPSYWLRYPPCLLYTSASFLCGTASRPKFPCWRAPCRMYRMSWPARCAIWTPTFW